MSLTTWGEQQYDFLFLVVSILDFFCSVEMEHCMTTQVLLVLVRVMVQVLVMKQIVMHMMMMMMMEDGWTWTCHGFIWELELDLLLAFSELLGWICLSTLPGSSISIGGFACMGLDSQGYSNLRPNRLVRVIFFSFFFNFLIIINFVPPSEIALVIMFLIIITRMFNPIIALQNHQRQFARLVETGEHLIYILSLLGKTFTYYICCNMIRHALLVIRNLCNHFIIASINFFQVINYFYNLR